MKKSNYIYPAISSIDLETLDVLAASASEYGINLEIIETEELEW